MGRIVDLSYPIKEHFRWRTERRLLQDFAKGDDFQVTWLGLGVHGFTHIDAPRHILADAPTTSATPLEATVGEAAVIDLSVIEPGQEITPADLERGAADLREGDIALLKTGWDERRDFAEAEFWTDSPFLGRDACEWLRQKRIRALGVDFPQDYPIRDLLTGTTRPLAEFVSHDVLLRHGIILIEYLCNLGSLTGARTMVFALPLKLPDADGAPARVVAWET